MDDTLAWSSDDRYGSDHRYHLCSGVGGFIGRFRRCNCGAFARFAVAIEVTDMVKVKTTVNCKIG